MVLRAVSIALFVVVAAGIVGCAKATETPVATSGKSVRCSLPSGRITPAWQHEARQALTKVLRLRPKAAITAARAEPSSLTGAKLTLPDGVIAQWYVFSVSDGAKVRGCLLSPAKPAENLPLVAVLHGHSNHGVLDLFNPKSYQQAVALQLAAKGYRVLAIETRSFGTSESVPGGHIAYLNKLRLHGRCFAGEVAADNLEIINWATAELKLAADAPIAVVGCSSGGLAGMFLAALCPRIQFAYISGAGGSWEDSLSNQHHCPCSMPDGLLNVMDSPQIFACMAAHKVVIEVGAKDKSLGVDNLKKVEPMILGLNGRGKTTFEIHKFKGGHEYDMPFLIKSLQAFSAGGK